MTSKAKNYRGITEAQRLRDGAFISMVREKYVTPLVAELEQAIAGYSDMEPYGRFMALMELNEEHAPCGESLLLDFGYVGRGTDERGNLCADASLTSRGLVFSGTRFNYSCEMRNGVPVYSETFRQLFPVGSKGDIRPILDSDAYGSLPLAFRVALVALYVRRNVFATNRDACLFAAGIRKTIELRRYFVDGVKTEDGELLGWNVMIRDARPENAFLISLGKMLRESAKAYAEAGNIAEYENANSRTRRDSTETLIAFIEVSLPARGIHVGRGGNASWKKAFALFEEEHPGMYKNPKAFENSYHNAKRQERLNREGR